MKNRMKLATIMIATTALALVGCNEPNATETPATTTTTSSTTTTATTTPKTSTNPVESAVEEVQEIETTESVQEYLDSIDLTAEICQDHFGVEKCTQMQYDYIEEQLELVKAEGERLTRLEAEQKAYNDQRNEEYRKTNPTAPPLVGNDTEMDMYNQCEAGTWINPLECRIFE